MSVEKGKRGVCDEVKHCSEPTRLSTKCACRFYEINEKSSVMHDVPDAISIHILASNINTMSCLSERDIREETCYHQSYLHNVVAKLVAHNLAKVDGVEELDANRAVHILHARAQEGLDDVRRALLDGERAVRAAELLVEAQQEEGAHLRRRLLDELLQDVVAKAVVDEREGRCCDLQRGTWETATRE